MEEQDQAQYIVAVGATLLRDSVRSKALTQSASHGIAEQALAAAASIVTFSASLSVNVSTKHPIFVAATQAAFGSAESFCARLFTVGRAAAAFVWRSKYASHPLSALV